MNSITCVCFASVAFCDAILDKLFPCLILHCQLLVLRYSFYSYSFEETFEGTVYFAINESYCSVSSLMVQMNCWLLVITLFLSGH